MNMHSNRTIEDIDFLPADFKRRRKNRHGRSWQIVVGVAGVGLMVLTAVGQARAKRQIEARLVAIEPERQMLAAQEAELEELRNELVDKKAQADLIAYLDHPWPKTQLLAAALRSLPETIVLQQIRVTCDTPPGQRVQRQVGKGADEDLADQPPAVRDLHLLSEECDAATVAISLEGFTMDGIELYRYLDRMNDEPLLDKVELHNLESTEDETEGKFRFEVRLTGRPGFDQPRGPDGRSRQLVQTTPNTKRIAAESQQP